MTQWTCQSCMTKITLYVIILAIVVYMYFTLPTQEEDEDMSLSFYEKWWRITPSVLPNMNMNNVRT